MNPKKKMSKYRSKFEGEVAKILKNRKGIYVKYEPCTLNYTLHLEYTPDWCVTTKTGLVYIEAKGKFNYIERRKILAVMRDNPKLDIRLLFMRNNKLNNKSKTRYTDWCAKHGIRCSVFPELPV